MITICSQKIVDYLLKRSKVIPDQEQVEVYIYGLECILNTAITLFFLTIWGFFSHTLIETYCWLVAFAVLRHHAGGLHAPTQFTCIFFTCLLCISNWLVIKYINLSSMSMICVIIYCLVLCFLYSPSDISKIELSETEYRKHKMISLLIIVIGAIISLLLPSNISVSIIYSFFCACCLIFIKKIVEKI